MSKDKEIGMLHLPIEFGSYGLDGIVDPVNDHCIATSMNIVVTKDCMVSEEAFAEYIKSEITDQLNSWVLGESYSGIRSLIKKNDNE